MKNIFNYKFNTQQPVDTIAVVASFDRQHTTPKVLWIFLCCLSISISGCSKFVEVEAPGNSISEINVFSTNATAAGALTGIYTNIAYFSYNLRMETIPSISYFLSGSADELSLFNQNENILGYYSNDLVRVRTFLWNPAYENIYVINLAIAGLEKSNSLTLALKQQLLGEAKFLRAFIYFYLVNLYGEVPLPLTTDWKVNSTVKRAPIREVYDQILKDLLSAEESLSEEYLLSDGVSKTSERIRANKWTAKALLARVYLYLENWPAAIGKSTEVIDMKSKFDTVALANVFKKNSKETIWALQPVYSGTLSNTGEGAIFILPIGGPNTGDNPVYLSDAFVNAFSSADQRKSTWINHINTGTNTYYYPFKYTIGRVNTTTQEYSVIFRLAEQILIRAEARIRNGLLEEGKADLNTILVRAGLPETSFSDKEGLLNEVFNQRRFELFTEWGHRWLDLKRSGRIDAVMTIDCPRKGGEWASYKSLYPIPQEDILKNKNLTQNKGYE